MILLWAIGTASISVSYLDCWGTIKYQPTSARAVARRGFIPRGLANTIMKSESSRGGLAVARAAIGRDAQAGESAEAKEVSNECGSSPARGWLTDALARDA